MKLFVSLYVFLATKTFASDGMSFMERISPPEDISENGHLIDWLFNYITIMDIIALAHVDNGVGGLGATCRAVGLHVDVPVQERARRQVGVPADSVEADEAFEQREVGKTHRPTVPQPR